MKLSSSFIPRFYAPLKTLTCQSRTHSPPLTVVNTINTATTFLSNPRMSPSTAFQSPFSSVSAEVDGASQTEVTRGADSHPQKRTTCPEEESHHEHHPTESTPPAPEKATSNAPATDFGSAKDASSSSDSAHGQCLALPPLPEAPCFGGNSAGGEGGTTTTNILDLGGQPGGGASTKLDHLGPLVVHQDGTMSRINNWVEMTEIERQNTLRILGRRNQIRLTSLRNGAEGEGKEQ